MGPVLLVHSVRGSASLIILNDLHCVKSVRIRSFSGLYFPVFGLITERYSVSLNNLSVIDEKMLNLSDNLFVPRTCLWSVFSLIWADYGEILRISE